ncbi:DUF4238 domain-containing protein [Sulfitobacter sp. M13]
MVTKEQQLFQSLYDLIDNELVGAKINQMHWRVWESPLSAPTFLTSDRPIFRTNNLHGTGAHLGLPISPRLLFIATPDPGFLSSFLQADQIKLVKESNRQIVEGARRFVYGCDEGQFQFIKNRFGVNPQPRLVDDIVRKTPDIPADSHLPSVG